MPRRPAAWLAAGALLFGAAGVVGALPQRTLIARPLPPGALAAAEPADSAVTARLTAAEARRFCDSLLASVSALRELKPLRPVPVQAASRAQIRARLEEITRQDAIEANLRQEETLFRFLGLVPADVDLLRLYYDLLEEQMAGFYDIDKREMVLADWLSPEQLAPVVTHELAHALQDMHFSLRVRKRLGFENPDAEAAWHALIEGDATAVMVERELAPFGAHFPALADSNSKVAWVAPAARAMASGFGSPRFRAAPPVVREDLAFPYDHGMRYVASLYANGGWPAVDAAYIHPPASTEQILHPDRIGNLKDAPVRITIPDLRGLLGEKYKPASSGVLGEHEVTSYLAHYIDPEVARVSAEGWGGCSYTLYSGDAGSPGLAPEPPTLVLVSVWDSEDDAVEFFGGLIGALEARYPDQLGDAEASSQDQVIWKVDASGTLVNVLKLAGRQVTCIEAMPEPRLMRALHKLESGVVVDDPSPDLRTREKANLMWNRLATTVTAGAITPRIALPPEWTPLEVSPDSLATLAARRGDAQLQLCVDRGASRELGLDGYAHQIAARLQARGHDVYVQTDVEFQRPGCKMYQHTFTQIEGTTPMLYYLGVADLGQGYGSLQIWGPDDETEGAKALEQLFYDLMSRMEFVPEAAAAPATPGASPSQNSTGR